MRSMLTVAVLTITAITIAFGQTNDKSDKPGGNAQQKLV
jgi:hypothetical protein